jgi:hypothetical protein
MSLEDEAKATLSRIEGAAAGLPQARGWLSAHRGWFIMGAIALLLLLVGYGAGRYATPAKVVTQTVTKTVTQDKIVYQDRVVTQKVLVEKEKRITHTVTVTDKKPTGEVVTTVTQDNHVDEDETEGVTKTDDKSKTETKLTKQSVVQTKTVTNQPNWRIGAGLGYAIPYALGHASPGVPGMRGAVVDVEAARRLGGPVWIGVKANTQGVLGFGLAVEF